jgi:hypothetical protein
VPETLGIMSPSHEPCLVFKKDSEVSGLRAHDLFWCLRPLGIMSTPTRFFCLVFKKTQKIVF